MKELRFKNWDCCIEFVKYQMGGTAIKLTDKYDGSPIAIVTKWLDGIPKNHVALDTNNCGPEIVDLLSEAGVIHREKLGFIQSGYCEYPVHQLL